MPVLMKYPTESVTSYVKAGDLVRSCQWHGQQLDRAGVAMPWSCRRQVCAPRNPPETEQNVQSAYRRDVMRRTCRVAVATLVGCVVTAAAGVGLGAPGMARAASVVAVPGSAAPAPPS